MTEATICEVEGCDQQGWSYFLSGTTVVLGATPTDNAIPHMSITAPKSTAGIDQRYHTLCAAHALQVFGVAMGGGQ